MTQMILTLIQLRCLLGIYILLGAIGLEVKPICKREEIQFRESIFVAQGLLVILAALSPTAQYA